MQKWKTLTEVTAFAAPPYIEVVRQSVDIGNGRHIDDFYQVRLRPFVIAVPVLENGKILTIRQYKHGVGRISLTFPAGFVDAGEEPESACRREVLEETGLRAAEMVHLGEFVDNGNQRGCLGNYYLLRGCVFAQAANSGDLEQMSLEEKTTNQLDDALFSGEIAITHHAAAWSMARLRGILS